MAETRAQLNRKVRQEALREQLAAKGLLQQVIESVEVIANLDNELDSLQLQRLKVANDHRLKMVDKYLPDLKAVELAGDQDNPITIKEIINSLVQPPSTNG